VHLTVELLAWLDLQDASAHGVELVGDRSDPNGEVV